MLTSHSLPVDSIPGHEILPEVEVSAPKSRRVIRVDAAGIMTIDASMLGDQPGFMGGNDPVALLRTLPAVATANELQATMNVRGGNTGDNLFESDGVRIVNPMHLLGLYSTFNPAYYRSYSFRAGRIPAVASSVTSGVFEAESVTEPDTLTGMEFTAGLIESHGAMHVPLRRGVSSLSLGVRRTYLSEVYPGLLKYGDQSLRYHFTDLNLGFTDRLTHKDLLQVSLFGNRDRMKMFSDDAALPVEGDCGWTNLAAGVRWNHGGIVTSAGYSRFGNSFFMNEGAHVMDLPTYHSQLTVRSVIPAGGFLFAAEFNHRHSSGQNGFGRCDSAEGAVAADWNHAMKCGLKVQAGLRMAFYNCGDYTVLAPQPRVNLSFDFNRHVRAFAAYGRLMRFDRMVEESASGLPVDFWTSATKANAPEDIHHFEAGVSGITQQAVSFTLEAYYKRMRHIGEFGGSLLDLANEHYNPLSDLLDGNGYSAGLSVLMMRQTGRVRGRVSYTLSRTRLKFGRYGDEYYPSVHDRPHDLNVSASVDLLPGLMVSASYTYATGTPYTGAKYGYIIGENVICEYYPHNSMRLPDYRRLDLSATYTFGRGRVEAGDGRLEHSVNVSVYNALANKNVLFVHTGYFPPENDGGYGTVGQRSSVMKYVIPSISYTIRFR